MTGPSVGGYRKANTKWSPLLRQCEQRTRGAIRSSGRGIPGTRVALFSGPAQSFGRKRAKFDQAAATNSTSSTSQRNTPLPLKTSATQGPVLGLHYHLAPIPAAAYEIDNLAHATPAQLNQLQDGFSVTEAIQEIRRREFTGKETKRKV